MVEKLAPVPVAGLPPVAVHVNTKGGVPPDPVAVQTTAVPTVPDNGQAMVTARGNGAIETVAEAVALAGGLASVTVTEIIFEPFTE